jgi:hypothetical protein
MTDSNRLDILKMLTIIQSSSSLITEVKYKGKFKMVSNDILI